MDSLVEICILWNLLCYCPIFHRQGFPLGSTIQSKTKGIWMWCVPHPIQTDHTLVLLDTEELGDIEKVRHVFMFKQITLHLKNHQVISGRGCGCDIRRWGLVDLDIRPSTQHHFLCL